MQHDINRCFDIYAVVPEVYKRNKFVIAKVFGGIGCVCTGRIGENRFALPVGMRSMLFVRKAAETDMLIAVCKTDPVIDGAVFFCRYINSRVFFHIEMIPCLTI